MKIAELVYDFKMKGDKLDSQFYSNLTIPQIIRILNEAQITVVSNLYDENNNKRGFESIQKRIDELQSIHVVGEVLDVSNKEDVYSVSVNKTSYKYLHLTRLQALAIKNNCCKGVLNGFNSQTDDLNIILSDETQKPNFDWRRIPYRIANDLFLCYGDKNFVVKSIIIDYLRYPVKMDIVGYTHFDGSQSKNVDCELPEFLQYSIVDEAVLNAKLYLGDNNGASTINEKIKKLNQ